MIFEYIQGMAHSLLSQSHVMLTFVKVTCYNAPPVNRHDLDRPWNTIPTIGNGRTVSYALQHG